MLGEDVFKDDFPFGAKGIFLSSAKNVSFQGVLPGRRKFLKKSKLHCDSPFDDSLLTSARSEPLPSGPSLSGNAARRRTRLCFLRFFFVFFRLKRETKLCEVGMVFVSETMLILSMGYPYAIPIGSMDGLFTYLGAFWGVNVGNTLSIWVFDIHRNKHVNNIE